MLDPTAPPPRRLRFGVFEFDARAGELRKHGARVRIAGQPLRVLELLLQHPGELVTRAELRNELWPADTFVDFEHNLNTAVKRLRAALGDSADSSRFIETVPRHGYRFLAPVESVQLARAVEVAAVPAAPLLEEVPGSPATPVIRSAGRRWWPAVALVGVAALVGTVAFWAPRPRPAAPGSIGSIAVLPLQNLSGDPDQEFFADGMTEALILELSRIKPLRVTSRTSAMHYRKTSKRAPEIARELGVDAIIEGSVQREGNRIRVTVQLIRAADDAHVWSNAYDRQLDSILSLHTDVARAIAAEVHTTVMPESPATLAVRRIDPDVYLLYVRGRQLVSRQTEPELRQALKYFEQVAAAEPNFAAAHAAIATVWDVMAGAGSFAAPREAFPRIRAAARRALEIDPTFPEALALLATVEELYEWRLDAAEAAYKQAIDVAPSNADVLERYSLHLARRLRRGEALEMAERAHALDPRSADVLITLASRLSEVGRRDEALVRMEQARDLDPSYYEGWVHLSHIYEALKRPGEQVAAARKGVELSAAAPHALHALARAFATTGHTHEAELIVDELDRRPLQRNPFELARLQLLLKRTERSVYWLERACDERAPSMAFFGYISSAAGFDPIRKHPRFSRIQQCAATSPAPE
jgi:TolB-like protein/DNA-binding winged helix-turn-helix (wHTH) protein/cytochrome c-type biogenesis protein CcmH/NrfG